MNKSKRYDEDFKLSIVNLYHSGKSGLQLSKDYGVAPSTISKWIKQIYWNSDTASQSKTNYLPFR